MSHGSWLWVPARSRLRSLGRDDRAFHARPPPSKVPHDTTHKYAGGRMAAKHKVLITCAVPGSIYTPAMSPAIPVAASEIADAAIGAAEAGAAVVHLHARDPKDGRPDQSPAPS